MNNQSLFNEPRYTNKKNQPINRKVDLSKHSTLIWAYEYGWLSKINGRRLEEIDNR